MTIITRYNIGEEVFYLDGSKLKSDKIDSITTRINIDTPLSIDYFFICKDNKCILKKESELFESRQSFLNQLEE